MICQDDRGGSMQSRKCPKCGSTSIAKILYGLIDSLDDELKKELAEGKVSLGGCCVGSEKCICNECKHRF